MNILNGKYMNDNEYFELLEQGFKNTENITTPNGLIMYSTNKKEIGKLEVYDSKGNLKDEIAITVNQNEVSLDNEVEELKNNIKELKEQTKELRNEITALHNRIDHFTMQMNDNKKRIRGML